MESLNAVQPQLAKATKAASAARDAAWAAAPTVAWVQDSAFALLDKMLELPKAA